MLVRTNARGEALRDRLVASGIPAVMHGASSVFASAVAEDWLTLLIALEQPRQATVRQAALTCFFGWTFARLAQATEAEMIDLTQRVRWWSRMLAEPGGRRPARGGHRRGQRAGTAAGRAGAASAG